MSTSNVTAHGGAFSSFRQRLEHYFEFAALGTTWRTEMLAGMTTFITMAYIIFVNPAILHETGMPIAAVTAATCLSAALGCMLMGAMAKYPIALAPGMGLNAYFTYTVVLKMGMPWQTALGAVFSQRRASSFCSPSAAFANDSSTPFRVELHAAVAGGIGLFIAFIGLRNAGHHRRRSGHGGGPGQPPRSRHGAGALRPAADRGTAGLPREARPC